MKRLKSLAAHLQSTSPPARGRGLKLEVLEKRRGEVSRPLRGGGD